MCPFSAHKPILCKTICVIVRVIEFAFRFPKVRATIRHDFQPFLFSQYISQVILPHYDQVIKAAPEQSISQSIKDRSTKTLCWQFEEVHNTVSIHRLHPRGNPDPCLGLLLKYVFSCYSGFPCLIKIGHMNVSTNQRNYDKTSGLEHPNLPLTFGEHTLINLIDSYYGKK